MGGTRLRAEGRSVGGARIRSHRRQVISQATETVRHSVMGCGGPGSTPCATAGVGVGPRVELLILIGRSRPQQSASVVDALFRLRPVGSTRWSLRGNKIRTATVTAPGYKRSGGVADSALVSAGAESRPDPARFSTVPSVDQMPEPSDLIAAFSPRPGRCLLVHHRGLRRRP